jgi:two-component system chemotaxis sensor kinase CheA
MSDSEYINDSVLQMYLFESETLLEELDEILLQSEKNGLLSPENVDEIFRIMHTIKGSSAMMDFEPIAHVTHKLEDLFFVIREKGVPENAFHELFDLVLKVSDYIKEEVGRIQRGESLSEGNDSIVAEIESLSESMNVNREQEAEQLATLEKSSDTHGLHHIYHLRVRFSSDCQMENIRAFMLVNKLESLGQLIATVPEELNANKDASRIIAEKGFYASIATDLSKEEIKEAATGILSVELCEFVDELPGSDSIIESAASVAETADSSLKPVESSADPAASSPNSSGKSASSKQNLINVDLTKLDALMDLVGEIVITESMVSGSSDLDGLRLDNFSKSAHQLRKLTDELQDIVMSIRMIPIASTFHKMSRIVRDMGKKLSKDVDLILMGETTEVDKTIIDGISDPLMHLVRNAMDHGIESGEERIAAGKDPKGKIILSAQNVGGDIIISISDDGKGLDPELILEKAKERNLLIKPPAEMTEREIFNLLTLPGFSTKDTVTEFSGRGVGMDVVRKGIEKIGGTMTIESIKGTGTDVLFKIPLTLAIIAGMGVNVGDNIYNIPIPNIRESFKATSKQLLTDPDKNEMIMVRGTCYPVIRLHDIFQTKSLYTNIEDGILLLVDSGDRMACIFADELIGKQQIVVKSLPSYLNRYAAKGSGVAGCTIMGNGNISLILDIQAILNR